MTALSSFQGFLTVSGLIAQIDRSSRVFGDPAVSLRWTAWMDPGVHSGFAVVLYAADGSGDRAATIAEHYDKVMRKIGICGWREELGAVQHGVPDLCSAAILAVHTELLTDDEIQQARTAIGRIRKMGALFSGSTFWDVEPDPARTPDEEPGIGPAGIGAESFINLRSERDRDYLSPVRIRSMFAYGLEEEFGITMDSQQPGDAKHAFSDIRMKKAGLYVPGPDHVRDALAHSLLAIRRNG